MALLDVMGVSVSFGGLHALDDVDLHAAAGAVTGLIGPNGAGKTTLFNVISGLQATRTGRIQLDGRDLGSLKPHARSRLGMARTFQRLEVFGSLTVRQNIQVAAEIRRDWDKRSREPREVTGEVLELVGLRAQSEDRVDALPTGMARLVELGRALATQPRLLLLDEPSSGLDDEESAAFAALLGRLAEQGLGILLVEHDVELVMSVCQMIHVLDFGRVLAVGTPREVRGSAAVQAAYLGTAHAQAGPPR